MSTSQKHADFVHERMREKPVEAIDGIADKAKSILNEKGFEKAYHLLGQFLVLSKDELIFDAWLQTEVSSMNSDHRGRCIYCLKVWCENNL